MTTIAMCRSATLSSTCGRFARRQTSSALRALHSVRRVGEPETIACRYFFHDEQGRQQSPWHHIPLLSPALDASLRHPHEEPGSIFHFVNEIPKGARAKLEIAGTEEFNPIKQDVKSGKPRFYHFDSIVNYGCLPQTWEDPNHVDANTKYGGDNDPVDVVEIGSRVATVGDVYPVKVLGVLGMIDEGETDWKVIAINVNDPLAPHVNDIADLAKTPLHNVVDQIHRWFRVYKIPDGKKPSEFAFGGKAMPRAFAVDVIQQTHESWKGLVGGTLEEAPTKFWIGNPHKHP